MEEFKNPENKQHKYFILDIGSGEFPMIAQSTTESFNLFNLNKVYIGLDIDMQELKRGEKISIKKRNENFIQGDGIALPFSDSSINEIFLSNIFGDPRIKSETLMLIMKEVNRVLKKDGLLKISETSTPHPEIAIEYLKKFPDFKIETNIINEKELGEYFDGLPIVPCSSVIFIRKIT